MWDQLAGGSTWIMSAIIHPHPLFDSPLLANLNPPWPPPWPSPPPSPSAPMCSTLGGPLRCGPSREPGPWPRGPAPSGTGPRRPSRRGRGGPSRSARRTPSPGSSPPRRRRPGRRRPTAPRRSGPSTWRSALAGTGGRRRSGQRSRRPALPPRTSSSLCSSTKVKKTLPLELCLGASGLDGGTGFWKRCTSHAMLVLTALCYFQRFLMD
uniref:Uncharacterized protein n=1 Tax=Triticum urartu TaxID=4572 RepID=A0A8R7QQU5_TRIUA